jgi:xylulose-5-phosphate/fructose-6-phosphate phosphoketolase
MFLVVGPGHGAPAILANLYLEGSLEKYYPRYKLNSIEGIGQLLREFSWPGGFPRSQMFLILIELRSHVNAEQPGCIHEGG